MRQHGHAHARLDHAHRGRHQHDALVHTRVDAVGHQQAADHQPGRRVGVELDTGQLGQYRRVDRFAVGQIMVVAHEQRHPAVPQQLGRQARIVAADHGAQADVGLVGQQLVADLFDHAIDHDQFDIGVPLIEGHQDARQQRGGADVADGDADRAGLERRLVARFAHRAVDGEDRPARDIGQCLALARQRHLAAAHHQRLPHLGLEAPDEMADGRLRHAELLGRAGEAGRIPRWRPGRATDAGKPFR
ncbi:Uncharacterised protein [Bordetella pertussis]|nr:Uncharacterised protein [Bordetella pertussis]CRE25209.1 Uncharacterised protein [Bordetella pertussis]